MSDFKFGKFPSKPFKCNFPCPCAKCKAQRLTDAQAAKDMKDIKDACAEMCKAKAEEVKEPESTPGSRFAYFLTEVVSILFFVVIASAIFWIMVTDFVIQIGIKIYNSDRSTHIAVLILFCLLTFSITYSMLFRGPNRKKVEPPPPQTLISPTFPYSLNTRKKNDHITLSPKYPASFNESKIPSNTPMKNKNITVTITDSEAKEIFRQSKLFAVPTEMKRPPALLVYLQNVILNNY